ncbi:MAG: type II toxin-antitoxin system HigA family antitoxin [Thiohalospira sp.]
MDIKPIRNEADYDAALEEIAELMEAEPGSEAEERLEVLSTLAAAYEERAHPVEAPDPVEAIRHALEARGSTERDLERILKAKRSRVWEIMNRKRGLSLAMIRRLHRELDIPAEALIQPYETGDREQAG